MGSNQPGSYDLSMRTTFGPELRQWRQLRGMSQMELATRADVSQRHISFLETGRSRPSREMVIHLGRTLDVPPREQNLLLSAAGHSPAFSETSIDDMPGVRRVLDRMLEAHEPYPALVVDRRWNVVVSNVAAGRFVGVLFPEPPSWIIPPLNLMRLAFHPDGLRSHMVGWEDTARAMYRRLERDVASFPSDSGLRDLLREVRDYPDVASLEAGWSEPSAEDLLVAATYRVGDTEISFLTTIAIIGDAHDLTVAELRIETFWPLDEVSASRWNELFGT